MRFCLVLGIIFPWSGRCCRSSTSVLCNFVAENALVNFFFFFNKTASMEKFRMYSDSKNCCELPDNCIK